MRKVCLLAVVLLGLLRSVPVGAEAVLEERDVLAASARAVPIILEARANRTAIAARQLRAEGSFDRTLSQNTRQWVFGDYDGFDADLKLLQPLGALGGDLTAAYRISDGAFPRYESERQTLSAGELSLGLSVPLLRGRSLDDRRFARQDASLAVAEADASLRQTQLGVQHDALVT